MARRSSSAKPRRGKVKYSALYVGSIPCYELPSVDDIAESIRDLVRSETSSSSALPRLSLTVSSKGLKVVRRAASVLADTSARRRRQRRSERSVDKVRHSLSDVLLVGQGADSDVRAAAGVVLHGFDSGTTSWLHVHVYWFDDGGPDTAGRFVCQMSELIETPQHRDAVKQMEKKMIASEQLRPRSQKPPVDFAVQPRKNVNVRVNNKAGKYARHRWSAAAASVYRQPEIELNRQGRSTDDCNWPEHQPRISQINQTSCDDFSGAEYIMWSHVKPSDASLVDGDGVVRRRPLTVPKPLTSVASELRARLATGAPILLPPKDYDTVSRSHGNLYGIEARRCVNVDIVGGDTSRRTPQTYL